MNFVSVFTTPCRLVVLKATLLLMLLLLRRNVAGTKHPSQTQDHLFIVRNHVSFSALHPCSVLVKRRSDCSYVFLSLAKLSTTAYISSVTHSAVSQCDIFAYAHSSFERESAALTIELSFCPGTLLPASTFVVPATPLAVIFQTRSTCAASLRSHCHLRYCLCKTTLLGQLPSKVHLPASLPRSASSFFVSFLLSSVSAA